MATYNMGMTEAREELQRIEEYRPIFEATHRPFPIQPEYETFDRDNYSYYEVMGSSSVGFRFASWGSIGYSAIRTIGVFAQIVAMELSENGWNSAIVTILVGASAIAILLGVEGYLYAFGQEKGRELKKLSVSWWGAGAALAMSGLAGLLPSLNLLPESQAATTLINGVRWLLAIVSGLGVLPLVYFGAENLGILDEKWAKFLRDERTRIEADNDKRHKAWIADVDAWNKEFQADYRKIGRSALYGEDKFVAPRNSRSFSQNEQEDKRNYTEEIRDWMKQNGYTPYDVGKDGRVTPVQIADELQFPKGSSARRNTSTIIGRLKDEYDAGNW